MIIKLISSSAFAILLCFASQSKADWVMDFGPGLAPEILNGGSFSFTGGESFETPARPNTLVTNHTTGHTWALSAVAGDQNRTATIRYEFDSLFNAILGRTGTGPDPGPIKYPDALVHFEVPLASTSSEGEFSVVGTAERDSGDIYTFTGGTPGDPNGDFQWFTNITMASLQSDDIVALNFDITFEYQSGNTGLSQQFTFGGPGGLIAAPEPTSAAMIGCALVGLIARRRRKA